MYNSGLVYKSIFFFFSLYNSSRREKHIKQLLYAVKAVQIACIYGVKDFFSRNGGHDDFDRIRVYYVTEIKSVTI